jgi:hypothetical protein
MFRNYLSIRRAVEDLTSELTPGSTQLVVLDGKTSQVDINDETLPIFLHEINAVATDIKTDLCVVVLNCQNLTSLRGLEISKFGHDTTSNRASYRKIANLRVGNCDNLKSISGVGCLKRANGLYIKDCASLEETPACELIGIANIHLKGLPKLEKIEGLPHDATCEDLKWKKLRVSGCPLFCRKQKAQLKL